MSGIDLLQRLKELKIERAGDRHHRSWRRAARGRGDEDRRGGFPGKALRRRGAAGERRGGAAAAQDGEAKRETRARRDREPRWRLCRTREREVLGGLVAGHANKQIAFDLGISPRTVEIYRANLMNKMQAGSLSDLVRMALIVGIVGPE